MSLGHINIFVFLVFLDSIIYTALLFFRFSSKFHYKKNNHPIVQLIIYSLGLCLSFSLLLINKICSKRKGNKIISKNNKSYSFIFTENKRVSKKEKFLWFLLVSLIDFIFIIINNYYFYNSYFSKDNWIFSIVFLSLFSYKILNYKLYKHHYLSIIIISIGFLISLIENIFTDDDDAEKIFFECLLGLVTTLLYSLELTIDKYLMFSKYINSYEIIFFQGIIELILGVISLIITTKYDFFDNFWDYYNKLNKEEVIILFLSLILNFIYYSLIITIIDILTPFFILFVSILSTIFFTVFLFIITGGIFSNILTIVIYFLSFIMLLIYTEIIELNCFGLSYMTKRNIELRAKVDFITEDDEIESTYSENDLQRNTIDSNNDKQDEKLMPNDDDTESSEEDKI